MLQELERFYEEYCGSIRREAEALRSEKMPEPTEELFAIYENTGNRLIYEDVYFRRRKFLAVFGLKAILDRQEEDIRKLEEILRDICGEECWALPAHVNRKTDENWRIFVDLFAAETAQTLSEITALLEDVLSKATVDAVRQEVTRRVLAPFAASQAPYSHWEYGASNWCAVCGGSVGSAAMYIMKDRPGELTAILDRICYALETYYLKSFAEDGACLEGLGYFTYGMTYFAGFARQLYEFTAGKRDLFRNEKLARIAAFQAKCYFPSGSTVSFADGNRDDTFRMGLTCFLAMRYPGAGIPPLGRAAGLNDDNCYRFMGLYRNLTWTKDYMDFLRGEEAGAAAGTRNESGKQVGKTAAEGEAGAAGADTAGAEAGAARADTADAEAGAAGTDTVGAEPGRETAAKTAVHRAVLPDAQWVICHSRDGAGVAAKGGHNGEPHNHNDVGSFFYLKGKDFLLTDLGCGEYTREYFSEKRYEHLCCRSEGHNVPIIDGREQLAGEEYGCDRFEAEEPGRTVISFAGAYANPELKSLVRTLDWDETDGKLQVEDRCQVTERLQSVRENLITHWEPEVQGNTIRIQGEQNGCTVVIDGPEVKVDCIRRDFYDHGGQRRDVWLIQWEVPVTGQDGEISARFTVTAV